MKKSLSIIAAASALLLVSSGLFARGGRGGYNSYGINCPNNRPCAAYSCQAIPNLTAEQSAKIQDLRKKHLDEIMPIQESMFKKQNELRSQWMSQEPDQAKIVALQKELSALRNTMQEKSTAMQFEIMKLLTPEQKAQFALNRPMGRNNCMGTGMRMGMGNGRW